MYRKLNFFKNRFLRPVHRASFSVNPSPIGSVQCLYETLELSPTASLREIKKNFKALTKKYHPDVYKGQDGDRYTRILAAYETLRNPSRRKRYDQDRQSGRSASAGEEGQAGSRMTPRD